MSAYPLVRDTGRGIVIHNGAVLIMERWRDGLHYFSIPGGGIEVGEMPEQTAVREIREETSCRVAVDRPVYEFYIGLSKHTFFLCDYIDGEPMLAPDSEEAYVTRLGKNRFKPRWLALEELSRIDCNRWEPVRLQLVHDLQHGFPKTLRRVEQSVLP